MVIYMPPSSRVAEASTSPALMSSEMQDASLWRECAKYYIQVYKKNIQLRPHTC